MSSTENTDPKVEGTKPAEMAENKPITSAPVFSMFGGGAKKQKDTDEDRGDVSGSAKSQREAAAAAKGDEEVRQYFTHLSLPTFPLPHRYNVR